MHLQETEKQKCFDGGYLDVSQLPRLASTFPGSSLRVSRSNFSDWSSFLTGWLPWSQQSRSSPLTAVLPVLPPPVYASALLYRSPSACPNLSGVLYLMLKSDISIGRWFLEVLYPFLTAFFHGIQAETYLMTLKKYPRDFFFHFIQCFLSGSYLFAPGQLEIYTKQEIIIMTPHAPITQFQPLLICELAILYHAKSHPHFP